MPRRSSRLAKKKRVNMNEDAMFYRATKTTKDDWTEVEDLDPVPVYRDKKMFRKKLPKKKAIKLPPKKKKRQVIDLTGDRDDWANDRFKEKEEWEDQKTQYRLILIPDCF